MSVGRIYVTFPSGLLIEIFNKSPVCLFRNYGLPAKTLRVLREYIFKDLRNESETIMSSFTVKEIKLLNTHMGIALQDCFVLINKSALGSSPKGLLLVVFIR